MQLKEVRKKYDENYGKMLRIIQKMGGDDKIAEHRRKNTPLYRKLKQLQKQENYLDSLENRLLNQYSNVRA